MRTKLLSLLLCAAVLNFSCSKEDDDEPVTYQLPGLWIGTFTVDQQPGTAPLYYSFIIKPDGKVLTEGKGDNGTTYYSSGTWSVSGSTFTATYTTINYPGSPVTQSATLTYNSDGTMTDGTWEDVVNPSGFLSGKFPVMKRVN